MYLTDDDDAGSNFVYKKSGKHWEICIAPSVEGHFQQVREMTDNM